MASNFYLSTNMKLPVPTVGQDPGPDYASNINAALTLVDSHNHSAGQGVQINPSGINVNADLPLNANNLITARSVRFSAQGSPISGAADLGCLYESGVDLYYNDGNGNQVRITQSGGVAGSPGSIANLTSPASATYVSANQTFVWQSAASTPANLDAGSVIFRNITASSKGITVSPPSGLAANSSLVLPTPPGATALLQIDSSGNITAGPAVSGGITKSYLAPLGQLLTSGCGAFSVGPGSLSYATVTNLSGSYTSAGRPIWVGLVTDIGTLPTGFSFYSASGSGGQIALFIGGTIIQQQSIVSGSSFPPSAFSTVYFVGAGTYTFSCQVLSGSSTINVNNCKLLVYELS